ncbi:MAG: amino acid adenylation domain-containing protein, partial [bacterium]|nr:amino acid adenylation domain-containing protein [bacterium]
SVIKEPGKKIAEIEIIPETEKKRVLFDFNGTKTSYPENLTIHQMFENQAEKTPEKTAAVFEEKKLDYRELNRKARQMAALLRTKGVEPDTAVPLMMSPSLDMPVAILAILKARGGFLPLDPEYPAARIEYILNDSKSKLLLTGNTTHRKLTFEGERINIGEAFDAGDSDERQSGERSFGKPQDMVYTVYTSGTTGKPKGVMLAHQNLVNYVSWFTGKTQLTGEDKTILTSSFAFDLGYSTIFPTLVKGGELHLMTKENYLSADQLLNYIKEKGITYVKVTPSLFTIVVNSPAFSRDKCRSLRLAVVGGEPINLKDIKKAREICTHLQIINHYGPTETTIECVAQYVDFEKFASYEHNPTIGYPIDNVKTYILDENMEVLPVGIPGELCIAGTCLARGYLNRPQLTTEKFVRNPHVEGELIYRTGDLARWMPDGTVAFQGRIDTQVKIRGFRIELEEIRTQLAKHNTVKEAVVICRDEKKDDHYICAYLVLEENCNETAAVDTLLKEYLSQKLPEYMIPSYYIPVEKIPLTPNGKIDKKRLPLPEIKAGEGYVAPGTPLEEKLTELWANLLTIPKKVIGIDANFFNLGGHSLNATVLLARIHKEMDAKIPLVAVFANPTIRMLAKLIQGTVKKEFTSITPTEKKEYYPVSSAQKRMYILQLMDVAGTTYNMPQIIPLNGTPEIELLEAVFKQLIRRHDVLRTAFLKVEGAPVQKIHENIEFKIDYIDTKTPEDKNLQLELKSRDLLQPFDLSQAPLVRVKLVRMKENTHILFIDFHHIISDGVSRRVLEHDFAALYNGGTLPPLKLQYKDFSQ